MAQTYTIKEVKWGKADGVEFAAFTLAKGDRAVNTAKMGRYVYGPCVVVYIRRDDGGIDTKVRR